MNIVHMSVFSKKNVDNNREFSFLIIKYMVELFHIKNVSKHNIKKDNLH